MGKTLRDHRIGVVLGETNAPTVKGTLHALGWTVRYRDASSRCDGRGWAMKARWLILIALGLGLRLIVAWLPISELITRSLPDDAFIYFIIARNIAAGLGATFDGITPTNGFHPLWALVIAPIFGFASSGDLPVHLALTVSAFCDATAGVLAGWIAWRWNDRHHGAAMLASALYLFSPRAILESVNGLETGLAVLMLAACVAAWLWLMESPESKKRAAIFGVVAGVVVLARSDLGLIVGLLGVALVVTKQSSIVRRFFTVLLASGVALAVVAPWFVWSQLRVGTVVQSSGVAIPSLVAYRIQNGSNDFLQLWGSFLLPIINVGFRDALVYPGVAIIALFAGLALVRSYRTASGVGNKAPIANRLLWLPLVGALAVVLIHTVVRWYPRGWYFVPLTWSCALLAGPALSGGLATPIGKRYGSWMIAAFGLIVLTQSIKMLGEPDYRWQADMQAGAAWLTSQLPSTETAGAFNAGIYAYYSGRRVMSLDGMVDWAAIKARRDKRLLDYFVERGGSLLIDHQAYLRDSFSPFFGSRGVELVTQLPVRDTTYGPIVVYRVQRHAP